MIARHAAETAQRLRVSALLRVVFIMHQGRNGAGQLYVFSARVFYVTSELSNSMLVPKWQE